MRDLALKLGIRINMVRPTRADFLRDLADISYHLEMPTGSFSVLPLYHLAKASLLRGYKVVLSGEGSDELFAGYARNEFLLGDIDGSPDLKRQHYLPSSQQAAIVAKMRAVIGFRHFRLV